jgi:hypothetical protein
VTLMWTTRLSVHTAVDCAGWVRHTRGSASARLILNLWINAVGKSVDCYSAAPSIAAAMRSAAAVS